MSTAFRVPTVINAAGKLTALGGSAQHEAVAAAQADAARRHVDMAELRRLAGRRIAAITGAEAACVTTGAAAGIAIAVAAMLTGTSLERVRRVPNLDGPRRILIQRGHDVDFGAEVTQMIRLGGGRPVVFGGDERVTEAELEAALAAGARGLVFVRSHHCVQDNRLVLADVVGRGVPVLVDAAAEGDLTGCLRAGADLATYSGGKAIGGPTSGFVAGRADLIEACELQQCGIARTMKVGKEQIAGLLAALERYRGAPAGEEVLGALQAALSPLAEVSVMADRGGRPIRRLALHLPPRRLRALVRHLAAGEPSIRTRNHQLAEGFVLFDPRELEPRHVPLIAARVRDFLGGTG